jgi:hypothetical protein
LVKPIASAGKTISNLGHPTMTDHAKFMASLGQVVSINPKTEPNGAQLGTDVYGRVTVKPMKPPIAR